MPLVSDALPNLIGGISQQAPALRTTNSAQDLKNAYPSVVDGLQKRPPSQHIKKIYTSDPGGMGVMVLDRLNFGTNVITVTNGDLKVFTEAGIEETVSFPNGKAYLSATAPNTQFKMLAIADTVFVLNTTVSTAAIPIADSRTDPATRATVYIKQAIANKNYSVYVNDVLKANFTTNNTTVEGTDAIASSLSSTLNSAGYTTSSVSSSIIFSGLTPGDIIRVKDGYGDRGTKAVNQSIDKFGNLPPHDAEGRIVQVRGDIEETGDDYYVEMLSGLWTEVEGYEAGETFNTSLMPHVLVDNGNGTWTFKEHVWGSREAGDSESNPSPSFVGNQIQAMFVYKGRMVMLTDENIVMSEVNEFESFYRKTLVQLVDTELIDIASTNNRVSNMYHGVPFNENILLFSDKAQFKLTDQELLSPSDVQLVVLSHFNTSTKCTPIMVGSNVMFVDDADDYSYASLREYFLANDTGQGDSANLTIQVPKYLATGVTKISSSTTENVVALFTSGDADAIYVYKYHWGNEGKVQSSWTTWTFTPDTKLLSGEFIGNKLYIVYAKTDGVFLDVIDFQEILVAAFDDIGILLDRRTTQAIATPALSGSNTIVTLPYSLVADETVELVIAPGGTTTAGVVHKPLSVSGVTATFEGDLTTENYYVGIPYTFEYVLNPIFLRKGEEAIQDGRLQMRYLSLLYQSSAFFDVEFTDTNGKIYNQAFTGRNFGSNQNILGTVATEDGEFRVSIPGQNDRITIKVTNNSPFPANFSAIEWEAMFTARTTRL